MAIELYWNNDEQSVLLAEFTGRWTWNELYEMLQKVKKITANRAQEIGAIIDLRQGMHLPGGSLFSQETLNHFKQILKMGDDNKGPVVVVGVNSVVQTVFDMIVKLDPRAAKDVYFVKNMTEAESLLARCLARPITA